MKKDCKVALCNLTALDTMLANQSVNFQSRYGSA